MNNHERFIEAILFGTPDKAPFVPAALQELTSIELFKSSLDIMKTGGLILIVAFYEQRLDLH